MMYSILKGYKKEILGISPDANILSIKILNTKTNLLNPIKSMKQLTLLLNKKLQLLI